jgi:leucyl-tRNA synthetase
MPQWAGSCWYYLRFCDPHNDQRFVGEAGERYWMGNATAADPNRPGGVDLYIGGTEHAVLHLLYARFWHKVLFDLGHLSKPEPFQRLVNQGTILGEDNQKMSKSRGNIVNPDDVIDRYGADAFRCYEMFMGPLEQMKPWSMRGVEGVSRFLARVWRLMMDENQAGEWVLSTEVQDIAPQRSLLKVIHATIKKVTQDIESLSFNTAISQMMVFVNTFTNLEVKPLGALRTLLILLNPFAPHITSELWEVLDAKFAGGSDRILEQTWPVYDEGHLVEDEVEIIVQVDGRVRDRLRVPIDATEPELERIALTNSRVQQFIAGKQVRRVITIRRKLVNIVTN